MQEEDKRNENPEENLNPPSDLDSSIFEEITEELDKCRAMRMNSLNFARDVLIARAQHSWDTSKHITQFTIEDIIEDAEKVFVFMTKDAVHFGDE